MTGRMEFTEFIKTLSDLELVVMQSQARKADDKETLNAVLAELARREKENKTKKKEGGEDEAD